MTVLHEMLTGDHEIDPEIVRRIDARESRRDVSGDVQTKLDHDNGVYMLTQSLQAGDRASSLEANDIVAQQLSNERFDPQNPKDSMRAAFATVNNMLPGGIYEPELSGIFVKIYHGEDGELYAASASFGKAYGYYQPKGLFGGGATHALVDPVEDKLLNGDPTVVDQAQVQITLVRPGDRIALISAPLEDSLAPNRRRRFRQLRTEKQAGDAARLLVGTEAGTDDADDRVAIVLDVLKSRRRGVADSDTSLPAEADRDGEGMAEVPPPSPPPPPPSQPSRSERLRARIAGLVGSVGATAVLADIYSGSKNRAQTLSATARGSTRRSVTNVRDGWSDFGRNRRNYYMTNDARYQNQGHVGRAAMALEALGSATWLTGYDRRHARQERWRTENRYNGWDSAAVDVDITHRERSRVRAGLAMAALLLIYRFTADPGEGPRTDKGWDLLGIPFDHGDQGQGDNNRVDYNWRNLSSSYNDDPTRPHTDKSGGIDLAPSILDGDPVDPFHWPWSRDTQRHYNPGTVTGTPAEGPSQPVAPLLPPAAPAPPLTPPAAWEPRVLDVEAGSGIIREINQRADTILGGRNFSAANASVVYDRLHAEFGNHLIELPSHAGPDEYLVGGDVRLAAPDPAAHFASQAIEQRTDALIHEIAGD